MISTHDNPVRSFVNSHLRLVCRGWLRMAEYLAGGWLAELAGRSLEYMSICSHIDRFEGEFARKTRFCFLFAEI